MRAAAEHIRQHIFEHDVAGMAGFPLISHFRYWRIEKELLGRGHGGSCDGLSPFLMGAYYRRVRPAICAENQNLKSHDQ